MSATLSRIPVFVPHIGVDTLKHLTDALDVGWLGMGAVTKEFEERIAAFLELKGRSVVATNTGTSALHIALLAAGVGPGDEVIVPSFNYVADHQAIRMAGAEPVMCDVRDADLGIDCAKAEKLVGKRTRAVIPLHFAGVPCDQAGVFRLARRHRLRVVEDAMHGFGTRIGGRRIGSYGDITCFSFDPVKVVTSIDGGCVVIPDGDMVRTLQRLRLLGVDKDTTERYKNKRAWDYDVVSAGFRYHLTNIMAAVGVSQIKRAGEFIATRQAVCRAYHEAFSGIAGLRLLQTDYRDVSPFIFSVRVLRGRREKLIAHLDGLGIDAGIHFIPVHRHAQFAGCRQGDLSVTERAVEEVLTLPLHSNMRPESVRRVIAGVSSFFRRGRAR
ncbi:MAG: DegT/DnrJ/EryC1/StrS family aminotransferase [Betaproteobacteria bacterium]